VTTPLPLASAGSRAGPALVKELPLLERMGSRYMRSGTHAVGSADDPIYVLNPAERAGLRRIVRGALIRAALAGVANAVVTGLGERYASRFLGHHPAHATLRQLASYWGVFGVLAIVFAIAEVAYLYWDALRAVRAMSAVAGLSLSSHENEEVALALARAALELPNPPEPTLGIDPRREAEGWKLAFASFLYKAKISVTNFLFKALVERALGRFATRGLLAFTAIPINATWNLYVCWAVLREARIRVLGPSAAIEMLEAVFESVENVPKPKLLASVHQALGAAVVRTSELHPNHIALMRALRARFGDPPSEAVLDEPARFLAGLSELEEEERRVALRVLAAAAILDGRLARAERRLLSDAYSAARLTPKLDRVEVLRRAFVSGDRIPRSDFRATA
jgi:hypothetical protein